MDRPSKSAMDAHDSRDVADIVLFKPLRYAKLAVKAGAIPKLQDGAS